MTLLWQPSPPDHVPAERMVDFDFFHVPKGMSDPTEIWHDLVRRGVPHIFYTPHNGGHWVLLDYHDIVEAYRNHELFSTYQTLIPPIEPFPVMPPQGVDPPDNKVFRQILLPMFTPLAVRRMTEGLQHRAQSLIDDFADKGECDFIADYIRAHRPRGLSVAAGCRLMGIPRSTYYDAPAARADDGELLAAITTICDEFESYGWRRVQAALRHQGVVANHKRIKRLMREHDLQPRRRRRYVATTDSDHDQPIFPDRARDLMPDGPDQLWVVDLTYVAIIGGFVYVAIILDAWSRRVVGYAIGRSIEARLAVAALKIALERRRPPPGLVHHSDRRNTRPGSIASCSPPRASSDQ